MLRISSHSAELDVRTTNAKLNISQRPADFEVKKKQAKLTIHTEHPQIFIDQRQCFNESGLRSPEALSDYIAQLGKKAIMVGISRRADEGHRLSAIEKGGNAIAEIARKNIYPTYQFGIVTMPTSRPKIDFTEGGVDIQVEEGYVEIEFMPNGTQIDYQPGKVDIQMKRYPSVEINYVGNNVDTQV